MCVDTDEMRDNEGQGHMIHWMGEYCHLSEINLDLLSCHESCSLISD